MSAYLLDTNVVSELTREAPDLGVIAFLLEQHDLWLSPIVLHELEFGLRLLSSGRRRDDLRQALSAFIDEYGERVLPLERKAAEQAARLRAQAHRQGHVLNLGDALIAGTAKTHELSIATRNIKDFDGLDVAVINPWQADA